MRFGEVITFVSLVIPCLNEEAAIGAIVGDCLAKGVDEVIVVDGGSTDATSEMAATAGARVVVETRRGYGRACAAGVSAVALETEIIAFMDGDGSDSPQFLPEIIEPIATGRADFVMGSRVRGRRQEGALTRQQIAAGRVAGLMMRALHGVRFTDMSPYRAIRRKDLAGLGMREMSYGWNLEMQMRAVAARLRTLEIPVDARRRIGGVSKVSGNLVAGMAAAWIIAQTFLRLEFELRREARLSF
ncbi:MAG TPA: glycosyltransferase family 2 protein [Roseiarcus sp.]|nr:glycosyltransferase family 2 protein [Roseiarcus sp.]